MYKHIHMYRYSVHVYIQIHMYKQYIDVITNIDKLHNRHVQKVFASSWLTYLSMISTCMYIAYILIHIDKLPLLKRGSKSYIHRLLLYKIIIEEVLRYDNATCTCKWKNDQHIIKLHHLPPSLHYYLKNLYW